MGWGDWASTRPETVAARPLVGLSEKLAGWVGSAGGSWVSAQTGYGNRNSFLFQNLFPQCNSICIQIKFKLRTISTRKIKPNSTHQYKKNLCNGMNAVNII
jgi:hypothetical protein